MRGQLEAVKRTSWVTSLGSVNPRCKTLYATVRLSFVCRSNSNIRLHSRCYSTCTSTVHRYRLSSFLWEFSMINNRLKTRILTDFRLLGKL